MTNTQKLIEEISKLNGHMFECGDFEGLMDKVKEVAEAAKAERDKEILEMLPRGFLTTLNTASLRKAYGHGFWECLDEVKALLNNQKEDEEGL